ncbi:MAG: signal peptidase II [Tepidisphaerales bacterium]
MTSTLSTSSTGWTDSFRSPAALLRFYGLAAVLLGVDLASKYVAQHHLQDGPGVVVLDRLFHLEWVTNPGAVFGIGAGNRWLFVSISVLALGFLTYLFAAAGRRQWGYQLILGLLLAGVLGNLYDRVVYGHVRDMFRILPGWRWPGDWQVLGYPPLSREVFPYVFNVADVLLCTGVTLMLLHAFVHDVLRRPATPTVPVGPGGAEADPPR